MESFVKIARYGSQFEITRFEKPLVVGSPPCSFTRRKRSHDTHKSVANIRRVQRRIRQNISALSFTLGAPAFATFTYTAKQYDVTVAIQEWREFTRRFAREFPEASIVRVPERHKDGGVHFHAAIFGLPETLPCLMKKMRNRWIHACGGNRPCERKLRILAASWKHGFVDLQQARKADSIGPYIAKYLTKGDPDWSLFGLHVASANSRFNKNVQQAKTGGYLFEMSNYKMPVAVDMTIELMMQYAEFRSRTVFDTKWLGQGIKDQFVLDT